MATLPKIGDRRSYNGDLCTVRYAGNVLGTTGDWLGVEWDDPARGKHSGEYQGVRYFKCKSKQPTTGSFVRPSRPADKPRRFLEALHEKYSSEFEEECARKLQGEHSFPLQDPIEISGKVVEEVGFDKIRERLAQLSELRTVLLDGLRVAGVLADEEEYDVVSKRKEELLRIQATCPKIVELDLSRNLLRQWSDLKDICDQLTQLKRLKLDGNRFGPVEDGLIFKKISELHINQTLLDWDEIAALTCQFPSLTSLSASMNQITNISTPVSDSITKVVLETNEIGSLSSIEALARLPKLELLSLRGNSISTIYDSDHPKLPLRFSHTLKFVDLSHNQIDSWQFVSGLGNVFPGLRSLRSSGNPLYNQPVGLSSITNLPERPMTVEEAYVLTLSRLATLQTLNYSEISPSERTNGELYYLSLIGKELSASPEDTEKVILAAHPRYKELCEKYGEPSIQRTSHHSTVNPLSVAARLVRFVFYLSQARTKSDGCSVHVSKVREIPRGFDTYQVKAIVSRMFRLPPYSFRLVWETNEWDPVHTDNAMEDVWGSSEEEGPSKSLGREKDSQQYVRREVELVDSPRSVGILFHDDLKEARVRIEVL